MKKPARTISVPVPPFIATLVGAGLDLTLSIAPSALPEAPRALFLTLFWAGACLTVVPFPAWLLWKLFRRIVKNPNWAASLTAISIGVISGVFYLVAGPTLNRWSVPPGPPQIGMCLVYPQDPALVLFNPSRQLAEKVSYSYALFDLNSTTPNDPLRVPSGIAAFIKAKSVSGPQNIFDSISGTQPKKEDRIVGSIGINCAKCSTGHTYLIDIIFGSGGWFSEVKGWHAGGVIVPRGAPRSPSFFDAEKLMPILDNVPSSERLHIGMSCQTYEPYSTVKLTSRPLKMRNLPQRQ